MSDISKEQIEEMRQLVNSGDLDLDERKTVFKQHVGRMPNLDEEDLLKACAMTEDDDDELFIKNALKIEAAKGGPHTESDAAE